MRGEGDGGFGGASYRIWPVLDGRYLLAMSLFETMSGGIILDGRTGDRVGSFQGTVVATVPDTPYVVVRTDRRSLATLEVLPPSP